nr:PREDICTED: protein toll-like isoform X2 [Linepithema humile]
MHLKGFTNLVYLDLSYNNILSTDEDLLADLPKLNYLNLRENNLREVNLLFKYVPMLQTLKLDNNILQSIKPSTFDSLQNLVILSLNDNNLTELPSGIFDKLVKLSHLYLSSNNFLTLSNNTFSQLRNLAVLTLNNNSFIFLPSYLLRNNTNLRTINLSSNRKKLYTLPSGFFSNLTKLRILNLGNNGLIFLPKDLLWGCFSLTILVLSKNNINTVSANLFRDLKNLAELNIDSNKLEKFSLNITLYLKNLQKLDASKNRISSIIDPNAFYSVPKLEVLNMAENFLRNIPDYSFNILYKLKIANFSHNFLTLYQKANIFIDENGITSLFVECVLLQELYLANNRISQIFSDWKSLPNLQILNLKYNYISKLSIDDLQFASKNIEIDLTYNRIQHVHLNNVKELLKDEKSHRAVILIDNNPIDCGCNIYDFLRYLEGKMDPSITSHFSIIPGNLTCKTSNVRRVTELRSESIICGTKNSITTQTCPETCKCFEKKHHNVFIMNCSNSHFERIPNIRHKPLKFQKIELDFDNNNIIQMPNLTELGPVSKLILSRNKISEITLGGLSKTIEILELHNNNISTISSDVLNFLSNATNLISLTLRKNPWTCNCNTTDFFDFVLKKSKIIADLHNVTCYGKNKLISNVKDYCPDYMKNNENNKTIDKQLTIMENDAKYSSSFIFVSVGFIIIIFGLFCYMYQSQLKRKLFSYWSMTEEECESDQETLYDAFISYSQNDHDFVMNKLVRELENGSTPLKLCLPYRDWLEGESTTTNIAKSVKLSNRQTVMVLSPSFLENIWAVTEYWAALCQALDQDESNVTLILYGDIDLTDEHLDSELKTYINSKIYIKWGDPWFWNKLRQSLQHNFKLSANHSKPVSLYYEAHQTS